MKKDHHLTARGRASGYLSHAINKVMRDIALGQTMAQSLITSEAKQQAERMAEARSSLQRLEAISYLQMSDSERTSLRT